MSDRGLRELLYRAVRELAYIQELGCACVAAKCPDLIVTSEGASIVMEGMQMLGVKDLSGEVLTPQQLEFSDIVEDIIIP